MSGSRAVAVCTSAMLLLGAGAFDGSAFGEDAIAGLQSAGPLRAGPLMVNQIVIPGNQTDQLRGVPTSANTNRLGGFISDLCYDRSANLYYGIVDRGPGGGALDYATRIQVFTLDVNRVTGAVGNFVNTGTILFKSADGTMPYNGRRPSPADTLSNSFDPEGLVIARNGNFLVAEEYGPSIVEFAPTRVGNQVEARFVRALTTPENLVPRDSHGRVNYSSARRVMSEPPAADAPDGVVRGRQDNRGYEGLALSADGAKLFAFLQDPLLEEGSPSGLSLPKGDGRRSRNTRIVRFDIASGRPEAQFIYQLEAVADVNAHMGGLPIGGTAQGRSIGINAALTSPDGRILVLERDSRGQGIEDPTGRNPVGSKRIYAIELAGATDVSRISLAGTDGLVGRDELNRPVKITPVRKTLYLDIEAAMRRTPIPEKIEGIVFGPELVDGHQALIIGTDNDFSVTQLGDSSGQFDVYVNPNGDPKVLYTRIDDRRHCFAAAGNGVDLGPLPPGYELLPTRIISFNVVPEPQAFAVLALGFAMFGFRRRRRHSPTRERQAADAGSGTTTLTEKLSIS